MQGVDRVMGQLAITRAIGDTELKPFVTSEPEIVSFELEGDEDFLIMGSDGLWDGVTEDGAASEVYNRLKEDPGKGGCFIYSLVFPRGNVGLLIKISLGKVSR